jgi:hypothetical protein
MGMQEGVVENPPLGNARRAGATSSTFDVPAHKLLHALIQHSPSPMTMAQEFLVELGKIPAVKDTGDALHPYG